MQLFLTGASSFQSVQTDIEKSLGGYVSGTPVPNNRINGLFSDISEYGKYNEIVETMAICLFNTTNAVKTNVSLTQIYSNLFTNDDNQAIYTWNPVSLVSGQKMEAIQNRRDLPFYGTFFEPVSRRADSIMVVISGGAIGDTVTILGVTTAPLTGTMIENLVDSVILSFIGNPTYNAIKKSSTEIYFQLKVIGTNTTAIILTTSGTTAGAIPTTFSNGSDGTILLTASLAVNDGIGLFITRTIKPFTPVLNSTLFANLTAMPSTPPLKQIEKLEVNFSWS